MKTFAQAAIIFMIVLVSVFVCFNLITGNVTDNEAEVALSRSVEQALYVTLDGEAYSISNNEDFINDFLVNLAMQIQSGTDIDVRVLEVDYKEGLMDVEIKESLVYPDGEVRVVSCRKTVILEAEDAS